MQTLLTQQGPVLRPDGTPNPGYSTKEMLQYRRSDIKAPPFRLKEWDFYQIEDTDGRYCLQLTYGHASYVGQIGVMFFDIRERKWIRNQSVLLPFPARRMHMPETAGSPNQIHYRGNGVRADFSLSESIRTISFEMKGFSASLRLTPQTDHALVINIPFSEKPTQFYYNYKQNCMLCEGVVTWDNADGTAGRMDFGPDQLPAYAILDWGRGIWPFHNEWYWSNGQGIADGRLLGFNLGCGFGDTSHATENILFYNNIPHKLGAVSITHQTDFLSPWTIRDDAGRLSLTMHPEFDRITRDKILFVNNCTHQVFGKFYGTVILDDGTSLQLSGIPAFAEHAVNNW